MALMAVQCENPAPHVPPGRPPRNRQHWIDRQRGRRWQAASCWFRGSHDSPIRFIFQIGTRAVGVAFIHKTETPFAGRLCGSSLRYYAVSALSDYSVAVVTAGERYTDDRFIHSTFHKADKRLLRVVRVLTNKVHDLLVLIPALSWGHLKTADPSTRAMLTRSHLCQRSPRQPQILGLDLGAVKPICVHSFHSYLCVSFNIGTQGLTPQTPL